MHHSRFRCSAWNKFLLALTLSAVASPLPAQVVISGTTATGSGDLTAGVGTLGDPVSTLTLENLTTVLGGRSVLFTNTADDVTVNADFSPLGLVNDPAGFDRDDRVGFHIQATSGSIAATLLGDATIQAVWMKTSRPTR